MAAFVVPSTAAFGTASPSGPDWLHEVKFDGRRVQLQKDGDQVSIYGGNGADLTSRYPQISTAICALPCRSAILDAELVACDDRRLSTLSEHLSDINRDLCCWSFDLLSLEGTELQSFPLIERKARLSCLLYIANLHALRFSDHFDDPKELLAGVPKRHMEGITSKKRDQPYRSGKNPAWITVKTHSWLELNRDRVDLFKV